MEFRHFVQLIAIGLQARIPMHMTGFPGVGKTEFTKIVSDCRTPWPEEVPPFPVLTILVGDGTPPPWGHRGANKVITIHEPGAVPSGNDTRRRWR